MENDEVNQWSRDEAGDARPAMSGAQAAQTGRDAYRKAPPGVKEIS